MKKYGVFTSNKRTPDQTFQGDYMVQDGQYVKIQVTSTNPQVADHTSASIHLDKGQCVKELQPGEGVI